MATEPTPRAEQRVQWTELFFDLIWVFAVTELTDELAEATGPGDLGRTLLLLVPLWWGWVGTTLLANAAGEVIDRSVWRMVLFAIAGCGLVMAVAIPGAYGDGADLGLVFAGAYLALRLILWTAMRLVRCGQGWPRVETFSVAAFVGAPLFVLGAITDGGWRVALWSLAAVIQLLIPRLLGARIQNIRFEPAHLPERFGLFLILALGESVVAVGTSAAQHRSASVLGVLALSFVIVVAMWWTYFHYGAPAVRHSLETDPVQGRIVRDVFSYAHLGYVIGIIFVAVGLKKLIAHPLDLPASLPEQLLAPGVAVYLLGFCYSRWRMFGAATAQRFGGAIVAAALAILAPHVPLVVTGVMIALLLVAINAFEGWLVETGRPLPLLRVRRVDKAGHN